MRLDELPIAFVREQVARLAGTFSGKTKEDQATYAMELQRATPGWTTQELFAAVSSAISSSEYFPRIRALKLLRAANELPAMVHGDPNACGACGRHFYYAGFEQHEGTVCPRLRCNCARFDNAHQRQMVNHAGQPMGWHTPAARAYREADPALIAAGYGSSPDREDWTA